MVCRCVVLAYNLACFLATPALPDGSPQRAWPFRRCQLPGLAHRLSGASVRCRLIGIKWAELDARKPAGGMSTVRAAMILAGLLLIGAANAAFGTCPDGVSLPEIAAKTVIVAGDTLFFAARDLQLDHDGSPSVYGVRDRRVWRISATVSLAAATSAMPRDRTGSALHRMPDRLRQLVTQRRRCRHAGAIHVLDRTGRRRLLGSPGTTAGCTAAGLVHQ